MTRVAETNRPRPRGTLNHKQFKVHRRNRGKRLLPPAFSLRLFTTVAAFSLIAFAASEAQAAPPEDSNLSDNFGRMFHLPPFAPPTAAVRNALMELGKPGGLMDANDNLAAGPIALIVDPNLSLINRNNPTHTAGITFLGQFLDHDMTFDQTSRLGAPSNPINSPNARTAFFDLDSVYAGGPDVNPELFDVADPIKFRVESGGLFEDLPRDPVKKFAYLGDPRNDENIVLAGLHAAFLLFHNHAVDMVRAQNPADSNNDCLPPGATPHCLALPVDYSP